MTAGPWLPISLKSYSVCISDLYPQATVDSDLAPHLTVELSMKGELTRVSTIRCSLLDCEGTEAVNVEISPKSSSSIRHSFSTFPSVKLWWPVGYGEPNLYSLTATLMDEASGRIDFFASMFHLNEQFRPDTFSISRLRPSDLDEWL